MKTSRPTRTLAVAAVILFLTVTASLSASVRFYFIDPFTGSKDTNAFYITAIGTNVLSNGGVVTKGIPLKVTPQADGNATNTLAVGHYSITNRALGSGVVVRVPDNSNFYDYTNLLVSGYNIFVTIENGDGGDGSGVDVAGAQLAQTTTNSGLVTVTVPTNAVVQVLQDNQVITNGHQSSVTIGGTVLSGTGVVTANSFVGDGSSLTGISSGVSAAQVAAIMATNAAGWLVTSNRMDRWVDATNGLDSNPGTFAQPWKTIGYAVSNATAGMNLKLAAGFYNASTNTLNLPHNVNLYGPATIISAVDLNYDGVAINPGNNSIISDITIQCDTNYIYTAFAGGSHSGYFGGTGVGLYSHLANNKSFTNATWINVKIKDATTDGFYFWSKTNNPSSGIAYNCEALAFSDGIAGEYNSGTGLHTNTAITFIGCKIDAAYNAANDDITFGVGSVAQFARGKFKFIGCTGTGSGLANGGNGQISATEGASVEIIGGSLVSDTLPFYVNPDSRMSGFTTANGTNYALSQIVGNGAGLTNLLWKTNYVAADFAPTAGYIKFVGSNNALYAVSATKTNLISAP